MPPKRISVGAGQVEANGASGTPNYDDPDRSTDSNVHVIVRTRPLNELERMKAGDKTCIGLDGNCVELLPSTASGATPTDAPRFTFDHVFSPDSTQSEVYEHLGPKAIQDVMNGYNSTIFAYGQTSSGKTHTMLGPSIGISTKETVGLIPRVVFGLFDALGQACQDNSNIEVTVKVSYVEIYMETIRDLLKPTSINLELREDRERGVFIDKVESKFVTSPEELLEIIEIGSENREQAATGMNAGSSRSHSVLLITVRQKNVEDESTKQARLVLVDLAGSESVSKTGAVGLQLEEAKMINKSLSALNLVISSLSQRKPHIPYRDSKLTRMLQESLGGNARTVLIICVSLSTFNTAETFSTIRFGACAKSIKNKPKVNMTRSLREVTESLDQANKTIARQSKLIAGLQATVEQYRAILKQHGIPDNVTLPDLSTVTVKPAALAAGVKDAMMATPQRSDSPSTSSPLQSTPVTNSRIPTRSTSRPSSSTSGKSQGVIVGVRSRPSTSSGAKPDALPVTFASVSLAPVSPVPAAPLSTNTVTVSLEGGGDDGDDDEIAGISSSLGVSELSGTLSSLGAVSAVSLEPTAQLESTTAAAYQVLELKDVVDELRRELEDKNQELRSKNDELTCLSASLLEKEKLIRGGLGGPTSAVPDEAMQLAASSMLNRELETVKAMVCKHCATKPFEQANTVNDLFLLHEQACFSASENKSLVRSLRDRVASLNSEVESLKSYVEAISMEVMGDNADVYAENQRSDRTAADLARAQALLAEREVELHKLHKIMKSTDPLLDTQTARKMAMLLEEIAIKENELRETRDIIYRKDLVLADLEEQLKRRGDASVVRELNHQLRQMVLVHRQLLRKFAVIDVECGGQVQQLQSREVQISKLNKEILRLNDQLREQNEYSSLQMSQLHRENMRLQGLVATAGTSGTAASTRALPRVHTLGNAVRSFGNSYRE